MPNDDLVVSDTSPLLNLSLIGRLDLLKAQFSSITAPNHVWAELTDGDAGVDALIALRDGGFLSIVEIEESELFTEIGHELDRGETAAICYAIEQDADLVLIDESDGRRIARRHDLVVTGVVGILLQAANGGDAELQKELNALRDAGFWISDRLYSKVLREANAD
ncbi:MAG: putative nucleic acid-binding protein, contains PIN domain protein [Halonotius sp. J07HN6]|jgi:Predicted nucleic acid-binding protein, contains PIN domain|nr:MAG: putative nucleic acid-binding protein, contains PIN domain protein [Halonotius sp. J07HN6]ERH05306.1 MAG: putative nucleic acid-binding protein, contains PIN domain protein [Halonotius sp. J07HN4]